MIRGQKRLIENKNELHANVDMQIHNKFDIEVIDAKTGKVKQTARAFNIVCNTLWTKLIGGSSYFARICYGSGTGTPSVEDLNLFERIGSIAVDTTKDVFDVDYGRGVFSYRRSVQLSETTAVGKTITEVGIESTTTEGNLCTHAMLEDMNGNAISIEKTDLDVINIYATIYVHFNANGYDNGSIRLNYLHGLPSYSLLRWFAGVSLDYSPNVFVFSNCYDFVYRSGGTYNDYYGIWVADHSIAARSAITYSRDYDNKTVTLKATRLGVNDGNTGGFLRIVAAYYKASTGTFSKYYMYPNLEITPGGSWFPYSDIVGEAIGTGDGTTVDFPLAFPFARNVKIYVDGVLSENVTVDYMLNSTENNSVSWCMRWLDGATVSEDNLIPTLCVNSREFELAGLSQKLFYNTMHEVGITYVYIANVTLYTSNDMNSWVELTTASGSLSFEVPEEYQHYKYWKAVPTGSTASAKMTGVALKKSVTGKVVHFAEPPAEGAVITADYHSDTIAKDVDHVFDFSLTFHFGEYTGG